MRLVAAKCSTKFKYRRYLESTDELDPLLLGPLLDPLGEVISSLFDLPFCPLKTCTGHIVTDDTFRYFAIFFPGSVK